MKRPSPYADPIDNRYAASELQHISAQRLQQNTPMNNFPGRLDPLSSEQGHPYISSRADGQWQRDRVAQIVASPAPSHLYAEGHGGIAAQSLHPGQMVDPKGNLDKQANNDPRLQSLEQDMEIGYEDKPSPVNFEGLEQKFQGEIMKLVKEQNEAEDAENARHRAKIIEINTQYEEKLLSLRAQQANRREEFLRKESQERLHQYHQSGMAQYLNKAGSIDTYGYGGAAIIELHRSYAIGQYDSYRERPASVGVDRGQGTEARVPFPEGRDYNNAGARHY